jgi:hypothetical protein
MPVFPSGYSGGSRIHSSDCGTFFHHAQTRDPSQVDHGARHVLGIQHGNQPGQRLFSIPRSSTAETLIFIVIFMALIAATVMWGCPADGCGYSGKRRRRHTDTTMHPYLSCCRTRWGRLRQRGRVAGRRPLPRSARSATCLEGCACGQSRRAVAALGHARPTRASH